MPTALIGRHAELQLAVDALKQARAGQTTALVLRGEPGIGKSRLLAAVLEQAELLGHRTLVGQLDDLDRFVPFAALRSAFLPVLADEHAELRDALTTDAGAPLPRLAAQIERCLRALALVEPVLLAIDDLHAADADTLTILSLLIRRMQGDPVTFVATTRSHLPSSPLLATAIDRLGRDGLATVVDLGPLDAEDVRALARIAAGAVPDELVVRALWDAAKGNPFYVEEGVRSLLASGELLVADGRARLATPGGVPAALRAPSTIVYRLFDLGPDSRAVARALTAFRRFDLDDLDLLEQLTGLDEAAVEVTFDTLVDAHLLRRAGRGFEFAHPIVRDTLYDDLGPAERRRIHAAIAARLVDARRAGRNVVLADLATHVSASAAAGDAEAITILVEAASAAAASAPASAAAWWARAIDLLPAGDARTGELLAEQAKALFLASQLDAAADATRRALAVLPAGRLRSRTAALQVTLLTAVGRLDEALSESDAILQASDDALPRLHAERGSLLVHLDRFDDATAEAETALALAGDDDGARALAYRALATVAQAKADVPACFDWFERQLAIARNLGPAARLSALTNHVMHLAIFGFVPEATATLAEADALRDSLGGAALRDALDVSFVLAKWQAGHWDDALERVRWIAIPPQPPEAWVVLAHCAAIAIEAARGNAAEVKRLVPEIAEASIGRANAAWARAVAHAMIGEIDAAVDVLERTWSHNRQCGRLVDAHHLLGDLAELELERGNAAAAHTHAMELDEACAGSGIPAAVTVRDRIVAMVTGETERALNALAVAEEHALLPHVAHAHFALGSLGSEPAAHLRSAFDIYRDLGAETLRRRVAHAMKAAGMEAPRRRRVAKGALTDTELKLSQLVHDGLTNREIANVLMVSPKTVEVYLSRLFAKTGCASRIELAVAVSEGRVGPAT